jgi:acyl-CoA-dependent ceramide synthase
MFRYLSLTTLCDATFVVFLVSWLITRQFGLVFIIHVIHSNHHVITAGWNPDAGSYYSPRIINTFLVALSLLLCLTTVWFYMACMVAVRVLRGLGAEDSKRMRGVRWRMFLRSILVRWARVRVRVSWGMVG